LSEKLIIRNFGPIKDVELDLKKFNVIIGEQATGKSTIAKVLAMCRYFSFIIKTEFSKDDRKPINNGSHFFRGLAPWGLQESYKNNSEISYFNENYSFEIKFEIKKHLTEFDEKGNEINVQYLFTKSKITPISDKFKYLLDEFEKIKPKDESDLEKWHVPTSFFQNDVSKIMDNPFYIPTDRGLQSLFSLGKNSIQNISDSLFNQFANLDLIAKNFSEDTSIEPLNIVYKNIDGKGYIRKNNGGDYFSLYNGASGYKSTIPIVLVNKYYKDVRKKTKTFLIEEPELNLFPIAQKELINYLVSESANLGNQILLTTHSPYILTSLNNLMYAHEVGKIYPDEAEKVIEKKYWLNPNDVSAYELKTDGTCEDIFNREENLIGAEKIDEISNTLNEQFDALLNIELVPR
jgi:predicted ATPase